jgi:hypothetical protein
MFKMRRKKAPKLRRESHGAKFFSEVLKKTVFGPPATADLWFISRLPATTTLRWLLKYRVFQEKYTWGFVKNVPLFHGIQLCKNTCWSQKSCKARMANPVFEVGHSSV